MSSTTAIRESQSEEAFETLLDGLELAMGMGNHE